MSRPSLSFLFARDDGVPDAVLLRRFGEHHDEAAFELLVRRYADVVWTVCRHTASDHHAAEDAFQATFLSLAKKAMSVRENLAGWLHRVGYHAALKSRQTRRTNPLVEEPPSRQAESSCPDTSQLIHAELASLPDRYRLPLLLCDLEGLTHTEAAKRLGWPVGSVSGRLVRGREQLKAKLLRHGIASAAITVTTLPLQATSTLIRMTTSTATGGAISPTVAALSHGVLSAMQIAKLKLTATIAAGVIGLTGMVTVVGVSASPRSDDTPAKKEVPVVAKKAEQPVEKPLIADSKQRAKSIAQLRRISLAFHHYHDTYGYLPADVVDKDGKPLLSWRVVILPFIEQEELFKQFKLDEAWDSAHNKKASETVVKLFTNGHEPRNTKYPMTFFQRPTGKRTAHEPGEKIKFTDIADGMSNTVVLVETNKAIEWAKPDDMTFDWGKPIELRGPFANTFQAAFGDGSARCFAGGVAAAVAAKFISRAGGEVIPEEDYKGIGWLAVNSVEHQKEAAELLKELNERTAMLEESLAENNKLTQELTKLQNDRVKRDHAKTKANLDLMQQLLGIESHISDAATRKLQLEERLRHEKKEPPVPTKNAPVKPPQP